MGYTDAQGRPEWIAQPFVKKGTAHAGRVSAQDDAESSDVTGRPGKRTGADVAEEQ